MQKLTTSAEVKKCPAVESVAPASYLASASEVCPFEARKQRPSKGDISQVKCLPLGRLGCIFFGLDPPHGDVPLVSL